MTQLLSLVDQASEAFKANAILNRALAEELRAKIADAALTDGRVRCITSASVLRGQTRSEELKTCEQCR